MPVAERPAPPGTPMSPLRRRSPSPSSRAGCGLDEQLLPTPHTAYPLEQLLLIGLWVRVSKSGSLATAIGLWLSFLGRFLDGSAFRACHGFSGVIGQVCPFRACGQFRKQGVRFARADPFQHFHRANRSNLIG